MPNVNVKQLLSDTITLDISTVGIKTLNNLDRVANDLKKKLDIIYVDINAVLLGPSGVVSGWGLFELSINTKPVFDRLQSLFYIASFWGCGTTFNERVIGKSYGDFRSTVFTWEEFNAESTANVAQEGQMFLNARNEMLDTATGLGRLIAYARFYFR